MLDQFLVAPILLTMEADQHATDAGSLNRPRPAPYLPSSVCHSAYTAGC